MLTLSHGGKDKESGWLQEEIKIYSHLASGLYPLHTPDICEFLKDVELVCAKCCAQCSAQVLALQRVDEELQV